MRKRIGKGNRTERVKDKEERRWKKRGNKNNKEDTRVEREKEGKDTGLYSITEGIKGDRMREN